MVGRLQQLYLPAVIRIRVSPAVMTLRELADRPGMRLPFAPSRPSVLWPCFPSNRACYTRSIQDASAGPAAIAAGVVAAGSLIFAANGVGCPLTGLAERLGVGKGSVTDIYLPRWFACNLPAIHAPLILLAAALNGRNIPARHLVALAGQDPRLMAGSWLRAHGLISAGVRCGE